MKNWKDDAFAEGAAKSLQKTLAEIDAILEGDELEKAGNLREKLLREVHVYHHDGAAEPGTAVDEALKPVL